MLSGNVDELVMTLGLALLYLVVVRFLDVNEREPLWSLALLFTLGGTAAIALHLLVDSTWLELTVLPSALCEEVSKFAAIVVGVHVLAAVGRLRGWSEVTDLVDGIVYGVAAGLGFAVGGTFFRWMLDVPILATLRPSPVRLVLWSAFAGLAHGVFGSLIGAGFGIRLRTTSVVARLGVPLGALACAILASAGYKWLAYGNALAGAQGAFRGWIALVLPVLFIAAIATYGLASERRAISHELAAEADGGVVSSADLALLQNFVRRQLRYLAALATLNFRQLKELTTRHNRQVMLALAKRREARETNPRLRALARGEVEALRAAILDAHRQSARDAS
ncbi:MAG TPA: PrsW family glutamic-type intramembrane protease [Vicinamibacterales bacterium]|jgi:hypothetical protein